MNHQEILSKATAKAIKNGWQGSPLIDSVHKYRELAGSKYLTDVVYGENWWELTLMYLPPHDFAKALWGEEPAEKEIPGWTGHFRSDKGDYTSYDDPAYFTGPVWKFRLQQMVIAEDPIEYLGDNL